MSVRVATFALLLAALFGAGEAAAAPSPARLLAPVSACPGQRNASAPVERQERAMACMHRYARKRAGRSPLRRLPLLARSSGRKSGDILRCDDFSHTACGREFTYWMERLGYGGRCWSAGENIAYGTGSYGTVRSIMRAWLNSPGHRDNILGRGYGDFNVGLRIGTLDGQRGAHVWTAQFGDRC